MSMYILYVHICINMNIYICNPIIVLKKTCIPMYWFLLLFIQLETFLSRENASYFILNYSEIFSLENHATNDNLNTIQPLKNKKGSIFDCIHVIIWIDLLLYDMHGLNTKSIIRVTDWRKNKITYSISKHYYP